MSGAHAGQGMADSQAVGARRVVPLAGVRPGWAGRQGWRWWGLGQGRGRGIG
jgi:hypothetical protein